MIHPMWQQAESKCRLLVFSTLSLMAAALWVVTVLSCGRQDKPEPSKVAGQASSAVSVSTAALHSFWLRADDTVHEAQSSLRSARLVARLLGGDAAKGNYDEVIALGHKLGGLGHDHVRPAEGASVVPMLDRMLSSIEALVQLAATSAELRDASSATDANLATFPPRTQRLYYLLSAKQKLAGVRDGAIAMGFRPGG